MLDASSSSGDESVSVFAARRSKRIKANSGRPVRVTPSRHSIQTAANACRISLDALINISLPEDADFEQIFPREECLSARAKHLRDSSEADAYGYKLRPLTISETRGLQGWLDAKAAAGSQAWTNGDAILTRRLKFQKLERGNPVFSYDSLRETSPRTQILTPPELPPSYTHPDQKTLESLYSICRTPYESSFAFRLVGNYDGYNDQSHLLHRDWETQTQWMELLDDIRLHYSLSHPDDEQPDVAIAPIDYVSLERAHLPQIHDLLSRAFWQGIDVSDSLQYTPTQSTIVAVYKQLVVGAAFLSSPEETYLTYLVVRPGWENANIASVMLYHLITANPGRDITLHVSASNPALLLYNKFGFKAEEFIVGFYEDYLAKESTACKNAFRLRLRR